MTDLVFVSGKLYSLGCLVKTALYFHNWCDRVSKYVHAHMIRETVDSPPGCPSRRARVARVMAGVFLSVWPHRGQWHVGVFLVSFV